MKIDLHVHTSEISLCGRLCGRETVERYKAAGYDAIVITNHYNKDTADHFARHGISDFNAHYMAAYEEAKRIGESVGLLVLCGYELRFNENNNDYLVYGMPSDVNADYEALFSSHPREFGALAKERDFLFYQAHPFRNHMQVVPPSCLFGIEVKNGNPRHDSRNDIAEMWAKKYGLHAIAGSDCHQEEDVGGTGIETSVQVRTMEDLVALLRSGDYTIL